MCANFSADKNELRLRRVKRFQLPPAGDEVEELSAIGEADEAFRSNHIRGKAVCEGSETGARKNVVRAECERFEFKLMPVFWTCDFFLAAAAEQ